MSHSLIRRVLHALQQDESFWSFYKEAALEIRGMDTDFPEEGDGPVRRFHEANRQLRNRAVKLEPELLGDVWLIREVLLAAERAARDAR